MRRMITAVCMLGLMMIARSAGAAGPILSFTEVCSDNTPVSANGVFNIDVTCPASTIGPPGPQLVVTGGYSCSCNQGADLLPVIVDVNTFFGGYVGGPFPNGWQTIGRTLSSSLGHTYACVNKSSGEVKVVPSCTVGTNKSPCHNNDICSDLSGSAGQSPCDNPISNPTCQVCVTCLSAFGPA